jgi:hypothetical protein
VNTEIQAVVWFVRKRDGAFYGLAERNIYFILKATTHAYMRPRIDQLLKYGPYDRGLISGRKKGLFWFRFQVLTAASMKMTVFWHVAPCSLVEIGLGFITQMMEAVSSSGRSVLFTRLSGATSQKTVFFGSFWCCPASMLLGFCVYVVPMAVTKSITKLRRHARIKSRFRNSICQLSAVNC